MRMTSVPPAIAGLAENPLDVAIGTLPPGARGCSAGEIACHVASELHAGRSLHRIVKDEFVQARIGFDGRAAVPGARKGC